MAEDSKSSVTPADALKFTKPTEKFLCPVTANTYGISFGKFVIRNAKTNDILLSIEPEEGEVGPPIMDDEARTIRYSFPKEMLRIGQIGTAVEFKVGT